MKLLKKTSLVLLALIAWTTFIAFGFINGFLLRPIVSENTSEAFIGATENEIKKEFVGNLAMVLIENGEVSKSFFHSVDKPVDENTVFPVASISKWVTSFGIMKLVEQGKLDIDKPIDSYLTRWHLPESKFDNNKVTIRRLLSHSAGLVDDLGYAGFSPHDTLQTIEESLTKAADSPYSEGVAKVGIEPGSQYMYSGAGYTILQLVIEEVSGQAFQDYMTKEVFEPLGMSNSTFILANKPHIKLAQLYTVEGKLTHPNRFTALAAAGLFTSTADLAKFVIANVSENNVLSQKSITEMCKPEAFRNDYGVYGLGPHLYSQKNINSKIIGHDGSGGRVMINSAARIDLISKNGIIIFELGSPNIASSLADEWIFWKTGIADFVVMQRNKMYLLTLLLVGYIVILISSLVYFKKMKK